MKKLISLALAALLLLNLAACGDGPAPSSSGSSGDVSSSAGSSQTDVLSPVATEAEFKDELTELKNMGATVCDLCFPPAARGGQDQGARPRPAKK